MSIVINLNEYRHDRNSPVFFRDVKFSFESGKIHNINGPNGSGKSTLLHIVRGDIPGKSLVKGTIAIQEKIYQLKNCKIIPEIALVNQRFDMMIADQFTFEENLQFCSLASNPSIFSFPLKHEVLPPFLERFGLSRSTPVRCLSGGQRQILALMMILQKKTAILLLDEPTATLDPHNARMVFEFLKDLSENGLTIVVISHDRELMEEYNNGQLLEIEMEKEGREVRT